MHEGGPGIGTFSPLLTFHVQTATIVAAIRSKTIEYTTRLRCRPRLEILTAANSSWSVPGCHV